MEQFLFLSAFFLTDNRSPGQLQACFSLRLALLAHRSHTHTPSKWFFLLESSFLSSPAPNPNILGLQSPLVFAAGACVVSVHWMLRLVGDSHCVRHE